MARKTLTLVAHDRPHYFRKVVAALSRCHGVERYRLVIGLEPGCPENEAIARSIRFAPATVIVNEKKLSCPVNTFQVLALAFVEADFVVHLEEDILPARDCLEYFEHCARTYAGDPEILSVSAYNHQQPPRALDHAVARRRAFTPWGWGTWRDRWEEMRAQWDFDYSFGGWDETVNLKVRGGRCEAYPPLARVQNIGSVGAHIPSEAWHEAFQYNAHWAGALRLGAGRFQETDAWRWEPRAPTDADRERFPEAWLKAAFKEAAP